MTVSDRPFPIAYLTAQYPAVSHTFILREIEALRARGFDIRPASVRKPGAGQLIGAAEKAEAARTFYILKAAKNPFTLIAAQAAGLRHPRRYLAALRLALRLSPPGLRALAYQIIYFLEATILARHLERQGAGHLHTHFANASGTVGLLAAELAGIGFSFTLHGPSDLFEAKHWRLDAKIAHARFVACISHFARSQAMLNSDPAHWGKLKIIHCGVVPELYQAAPERAPGGVRLVFTGRLAPVKGLRVLLEALPEVLKTRPDLHLTLIGDGEDRAALQALAAPLGAAVEFTGYLSQDDVARRLAGADILVLPSFAEGVPVVLMEAMASGKPVIATRVAGVAELVEDGTSGLLVPPGDAAALAAAITALAGDPERRAAMGAAGRAHVSAEFDIRHEAARLAALFEGRAGDAVRPDPA